MQRMPNCLGSFLQLSTASRPLTRLHVLKRGVRGGLEKAEHLFAG
jgi:hypothetical protein